MNNEPVAYVNEADGLVCAKCYKPFTKELTDEEIDYCWSHSHGNTPWTKQKAFARAILRKAQEK